MLDARPGFCLQVVRQRGSAFVRVGGDLDDALAGVLAKHLDDIAADDAAASVILDLDGVHRAEVDALGSLVAFDQRLQRRGGQLTVLDARPAVRHALDVAGVSGSVRIDASGR